MKYVYRKQTKIHRDWIVIGLLYWNIVLMLACAYLALMCYTGTK